MKQVDPLSVAGLRSAAWLAVGAFPLSRQTHPRPRPRPRSGLRGVNASLWLTPVPVTFASLIQAELQRSSSRCTFGGLDLPSDYVLRRQPESNEQTLATVITSPSATSTSWQHPARCCRSVQVTSVHLQMRCDPCKQRVSTVTGRRGLSRAWSSWGSVLVAPVKDLRLFKAADGRLLVCFGNTPTSPQVCLIIQIIIIYTSHSGVYRITGHRFTCELQVHSK